MRKGLVVPGGNDMGRPLADFQFCVIAALDRAVMESLH